MIRQPAVAGELYPADPAALTAALDRHLTPANPPRSAVAVVAPHSHWDYCGATAGAVFGAVAVPDRVLLIGPNHRRDGSPYALCETGAWQTPLGPIGIAGPLAAELLDHCELLASDSRPHAREHSIETLLPWLQRRNPAVQIVPLLIGGDWPWSGGRHCLKLIGQTIGAVIGEYGRPVLIVASTDLNHAEDAAVARIKDKLVLEAIVNLDEDGLMQRVIEVEVSMCGVAATYIALVAAKVLRARAAELLDQRTSGDVTGDHSSVVGYGGVAIWPGAS